MEHVLNYIDGSYSDGGDNAISVFDPSNGQLLGTHASASAYDIDLAVVVLSAPEVDPSPPSDINAKQRFIFGRVAMQTYWDYFCRRAERASREHEPQAKPQAALQGALQ